MIDVQSFLGRQERQSDVAEPQRMSDLAALLDHDGSSWTAGVLPPLGHWLYFLPQVRQSRIGIDGHPLRDDGGLLPTVDLPRRMWAGSRIDFIADIPLGAAIERTSTLIAATPKSGRSGNMLLATVRHEIAPQGGAPAIVEEQDIVYREAAVAGAPFHRPSIDAGDPEAAARSITADPVMLFRYSALTFNCHRIHYDRDYARDVEGYPGLVVHGPLIATLMLDHLMQQRPGVRIATYNFRAMSPTFDGETIRLGMIETRGGASPRAVSPAGVAMTAIAGFAA
jgi:3-methylfumaryl-CoA hydratase